MSEATAETDAGVDDKAREQARTVRNEAAAVVDTDQPGAPIARAIVEIAEGTENNDE